MIFTDGRYGQTILLRKKYCIEVGDCRLRKEFIRILVCPICYDDLDFRGNEANCRLQEGHLKSASCSRTFQVRDQIPDLRIGDLSKELLTEKRVLELLDLNEETLKSWVEERKTYPENKPIEVQEADELMEKGICSQVERFPFILDIASGRGSLLKKIARAHSNIRLLGTDIDENMLREAQKILRRENLYQQTSLLLCDVRRLPFRLNSIPCVVSLAGFSNVQNAAKALAEARRVLSPGGRVIFSTLFLNEGSRSFEYTRRLGLADIICKERLRKSLDKAKLKLLSLEEIYSGIYPGYSEDLLPFRGDWFSENLVIATTKNSSG